MKKIEAKIIADSMSPQGYRITSILLTYPRFIHSELMTHRMFSRNSASSRAIPFAKMIKMVEENPFIPIAWQKDHKGMQGTEYITNPTDIRLNLNFWLLARDNAVSSAKYLNHGVREGRDNGVTKQLCNRLLEPFMWHTVLVTATEWDNFFELRCPKYGYKEEIFKSKKDCINSYTHGLGEGFKEDREYLSSLTDLDWLKINTSQAEIHIQALAEAMWDAMNESTPKQLEAGEWHIPFQISGEEASRNAFTETARIKISTARCARLSYMTFDGEMDYEKDINLHDHLLESHHMSPFEHCARAMSDEEYFSHFKGNKEWIFTDESKFSKAHGWCNNFKGWISYRYLVEEERKKS